MRGWQLRAGRRIAGRVQNRIACKDFFHRKQKTRVTDMSIDGTICKEVCVHWTVTMKKSPAPIFITGDAAYSGHGDFLRAQEVIVDGYFGDRCAGRRDRAPDYHCP